MATQQENLQENFSLYGRLICRQNNNYSAPKSRLFSGLKEMSGKRLSEAAILELEALLDEQPQRSDREIHRITGIARSTIAKRRMCHRSLGSPYVEMPYESRGRRRAFTDATLEAVKGYLEYNPDAYLYEIMN